MHEIYRYKYLHCNDLLIYVYINRSMCTKIKNICAYVQINIYVYIHLSMIYMCTIFKRCMDIIVKMYLYI